MKAVKTAIAAEEAGIERITLQRWIRDGKVRAPKPVIEDGRAVRLWTSAHIAALKAVKAEIYRKGRGRKKRGPK